MDTLTISYLLISYQTFPEYRQGHGLLVPMLSSNPTSLNPFPTLFALSTNIGYHVIDTTIGSLE